MVNDPRDQQRRFQLTEGGAEHRLEMRMGLKRPNNRNIPLRTILSLLVTWVPLLILSAIEGNASGNHVTVVFLHDFAVHARFLLAVPLLILAESVLGPRLETAADYFVDSKLIVGEDVPRFKTAIEHALHGRDSILADLILLLLSYTACGRRSTWRLPACFPWRRCS